MPYRFKYRNGERKYLLKRALEGVLPAEILARRKKGFGIPLANWLRTVPKEPPLSPVAGIYMDRIPEAWQAHRAAQADHRLLMWSWLSLQNLPYFSGAHAARKAA